MCWHSLHLTAHPLRAQDKSRWRGTEAAVCGRVCAGASLRKHSWMSLISNTQPPKYTGRLCIKFMQAGWDYEIRFCTMLEQLYSSGLL